MTSRTSRWILALTLGLLPLLELRTHAHRLSSATLRIERDPTTSGWNARLTVPLRDLAMLLPIDANQDDAITWGELQNADPALRTTIRSHLAPTAGQDPVDLRFEPVAVDTLAGEPCASWDIALIPSPRTTSLTLRYTLLFDVDPEHRCLVNFVDASAPEFEGTVVLAPDRPTLELAVAPTSTPPTSWAVFVREGIHHIGIGFDHLLFLVALLLPSVLQHRRHDPGDPLRFRDIAGRIVRIVTAFTLAHSLTLGLAASGWVHLPSRWVETLIAGSVAIAAFNNLVPLLRDRTWQLAFAFGLVHGFGFAGVLSDLELPPGDFARGLVGFNLGVEIGQLALVALFLPIAYGMRHSWFYRRVALQGGSIAIVGLATLWAVERALGA